MLFFKVYKLHLASPKFTRYSGLMDTHMDTTGFFRLPFNFLQFFFGNDIVAPKNWSGSVPGDGHDGKVVVASDAQIVYGTVAQVMECKISQSCLLYSKAPL